MKIAIIGGTGFALPDYLTDFKEIAVDTPFGKPAPVLYSGKLDGMEVIHLARNGKNHELPPTKINYRANMYALKKLDVDQILATGTCDSMKEKI